MRRQPTSTRRRFLRLAGSTAAIGALPLAIRVRPVEATPETMAAAIRNVVGGAVIQNGKVRLEIPPLVENGNSVPMTVSVASPMTANDYVKSIYVFNEKIRSPTSATFIWGHGPAVPRFQPACGSPTVRGSPRSQSFPTARSGPPRPTSW